MLRLGVDNEVIRCYGRALRREHGWGSQHSATCRRDRCRTLLLGMYFTTSNEWEDSLLTCLSARIMRFLAAMGIVREVSNDSFTSTLSTAMFISSSPLAAVLVHGYVLSPGTCRDIPCPLLTRCSTHYLTVLSKLPDTSHRKDGRSQMMRTMIHSNSPWVLDPIFSTSFRQSNTTSKRSIPL